jgi:3',5'-cyclic-AMP phosphodiesterase
MLIAQITDLHIPPPGQLSNGRVDTAAHLASAVRRLNALTPRPDLVLVTGDLVDHGTPEEYSRLRALLAPLQAPAYLLMGNHDHRAHLRGAFPEHGYLPAGPFIQYAIEGFPVRVLALDTQDPGKGSGLLCPDRLTWLDQRLSEQPERPTVLAMHHPPYSTGNQGWDRYGLEGAEGLAAVVSTFRNVKAILCGHLHRPTQALFGGTVAMSCPSTAHQLHFGLGDATFGFDLEPPSFQLHLWNGRALVTHTALVERYPGPFAFGDGRELS